MFAALAPAAVAVTVSAAPAVATHLAAARYLFARDEMVAAAAAAAVVVLAAAPAPAVAVATHLAVARYLFARDAMVVVVVVVVVVVLVAAADVSADSQRRAKPWQGTKFTRNACGHYTWQTLTTASREVERTMQGIHTNMNYRRSAMSMKRNG